MKVTTATLEELTPAPRERKPSPRQLAAQKRDALLRTALDRAERAADRTITAIELEHGEKLPSIRRSLAVLWQKEPRKLSLTARGNVIYVSKAPLPRAWRL